jgi:hypothetical protein
LKVNSGNAAVVETTGKNSLRGFGPGGRIPRDSAMEVTSPLGMMKQNGGVMVEEVEDTTSSWRGPRDDREDEESAVSFSVKRPVFF